MFKNLNEWEIMLKKMVWAQLGNIENKKILDFGSGIRTFWDLQQNQEIHKDAEWQEKMLEVEMRVCDIDEYKNISFFHHLILCK